MEPMPLEGLINKGLSFQEGAVRDFTSRYEVLPGVVRVVSGFVSQREIPVVQISGINSFTLRKGDPSRMGYVLRLAGNNFVEMWRMDEHSVGDYPGPILFHVQYPDLIPPQEESSSSLRCGVKEFDNPSQIDIPYVFSGKRGRVECYRSSSEPNP